DWTGQMSAVLRAFRGKRRSSVLASVGGPRGDAPEATERTLLLLIAAEALRRNPAAQEVLGELEASSAVALADGGARDLDAFCSATLDALTTARQMPEMQKALSGLEADRDEARKTAASDLAALRGDLATAQASLAKVQASREELESRIDDYVAQIDSLTDEHSDAKQALDAAMAQITQLA